MIAKTISAVLTLILATGCYIQPTERIPTGDHPNDSNYTNIRIDEDFTSLEANAIKQAITEWRVATDQVFYFSWHTGQVSPGTPYSVMKAGKGGKNILTKPGTLEAVTPGLLGWVDGAETYITLFTDNIAALAVSNQSKHLITRVVMLHELGHYMGLRHSNNPASLMYSRFGVGCITKHDIAQFCSIYDCTDRDVAPSCANAWEPELVAGLVPEFFADQTNVRECNLE